MSNSSEICLDANLVIRYVTGLTSAAVAEVWRGFTRDRVTLHAPTLLCYETVNVIHQKRRANEIDAADAAKSLTRALLLPIRFHRDDALHMRAFQLAAEHGLGATYDAHYLALAERLGIELYTTDQKLFKAVNGKLPWVRLVS